MNNLVNYGNNLVPGDNGGLFIGTIPIADWYAMHGDASGLGGTAPAADTGQAEAASFGDFANSSLAGLGAVVGGFPGIAAALGGIALNGQPSTVGGLVSQGLGAIGAPSMSDIADAIGSALGFGADLGDGDIGVSGDAGIGGGGGMAGSSDVGASGVGGDIGSSGDAGIGGGGGAAGADAGGDGGFRMGGLVVGPGGPMDDAVPAHLSSGEFVMNADAVNRIGLNHLARMNAGQPFNRLRHHR